jgi:hypothetical protein
MLTTAMHASVLAADLEARGIIAGIGKLILIVIIVLIVLGALIGFRLGRGRGRR